MAGVTGLWRVLERHKSKIGASDADKIVYALRQKGLIGADEEQATRNERSQEKKVDVLVDILSKKGFAVFREFCATLEAVSPCLLTSFLLDIFDSLNEDRATAQSLRRELALGDRIPIVRPREKDRNSLSSKPGGYLSTGNDLRPPASLADLSFRRDPLSAEEWDGRVKRWRHSVPSPHSFPRTASDPQKRDTRHALTTPILTGTLGGRRPERKNRSVTRPTWRRGGHRTAKYSIRLSFGIEIAKANGNTASIPEYRISNIIKATSRIRRERPAALSGSDYAAKKTAEQRADLRKPSKMSPAAVLDDWRSRRTKKDKRSGIRVRARILKDGQRVTWEFRTVTLTRVPGYGFGIAVSGGRDNPHFANGDPAIAVSDVLKAGPAEGKLRVNDRVISANGISLENVNYNTAVQVLRDCGPSVDLVIKRRVVLPPPPDEPQSIKITLTKSKKKEDFGIVLGCRIYVKEITNRSLMEKEGGVREGDVIVKINATSTDAMSLKEARKLIENSKERLQLIVRREAGRRDDASDERRRRQWSDGTPFEVPRRQNKDHAENFVDVAGSGLQWTNQNLYVQPPTRGDYRSPISPDCNEDKNNLSRMQGGRNRGPLMDISLSQLDQPATPLLTGHGHSRAPISLEDEEPPPRPPLPRIDEYGGRREAFDEELSRRNKTMSDPRFVSFQKEGSVGIRLTGGNEVGIFVTAVQPGSPALLQGLQPGDKILKVNDVDMRGMTREEAVLLLLTIQDRVNLIVQHFKEEYDEVVSNQRGDSFYVRTHFSYEGSGKSELNFRVGEIFHVIDTLHNGVVGSWLVYRLGRNNQEIQKGIIPNRNRAEEWAQEQQIQAKKDTASESRGSFFKRRSARRSKSLSKDHWEDIVFADGLSKFPAYERVTLKHPGFTRPVVLFGPLADVARDKLLKDYPDQYASPQLDSQLDDIPKSQKSSGIIRLSAIKEIIQKGKHAVLDITPNAVDRLNYAQFYPIVIFMHAENKHTVKELRSRLAKSSHKSSKKLYDHATKLEKLWSHIFTAVITLSGADMWYKKLRDTIDKQQQQAIWVSESKPQETISDDFLFPMTSRLSYASSPESDLDLTTDTRPMSLQARSTSPPGAERHMVKASSDPSIATQEDMGGLPGYSQLPPYSILTRSRQLPFHHFYFKEAPTSVNHLGQETINHDILSSQRQQIDETDRDLYYGSTMQSSIDPYSTLSRERAHKSNEGSDLHQSKNRSNQPEPPPRIDRSSKPTHFRGNQDRTFGSPIRTEHSQDPVGISADYINTTNNKSHSLERSNGRLGGFDSSSFSSDSYNKYSVAPNALDNKPRDRYSSTSGPNPRSTHDPYRFTRSTAQPSKTVNTDIRNRMSQVSSKYRYLHQSKNRSNQPEPPPRIDRSSKPTHFRGNQDRTFGSPIRTEHSQDPVGISADYINTTNNKSHSLERSNGRLGGFDSSSFSSDSYNKYSVAPNALDNKPRDRYSSTSGPNPRSTHDPYRFTRSTAQPSKTVNTDIRNRMSQVSSKYRMSDGRPVPPPKPSQYQLRPWQSEDDGIETGFNHVGHAPAGFRSSEALPPPPYSRSSRDCSEFPTHPPYYSKQHPQMDASSSRPPPPPMPDDQRGLHDTYNSRTMGSPSRRGYHDNDSAGFDSGRGSSLDRNYDFRAYSKSVGNGTGMSPPRPTTHLNGGGPYHNIPYPPRREPPNPPPYDHHPSPPPPPPPSGLLDLSNRENRGSAFELYKKPDSRSPLGMPPSVLAGNPERPKSPSPASSDIERNVVATARGIFDHTGGTLSSEETGVCIVIPPGALPEGKEQEIFFKVCREDKMMPPLDRDKGETLLSPLVMCGPPGLHFDVPIQLKMPHCASVNPENWSFSLKASDTPDGRPIEWRNVTLDHEDGKTESSVDDNFVTISVDHF
ncbi:tight junction protein ZO-1-like [Centruroides sculpturatus]|uniref:tight junction protein ZO-1-like n=1 Tax=Centruroides sculpturatus TaxID=218467 RepID=UPI000C6CC9B3|nr:tight junction protein ZO-1-like [Centruroides sculpturatus]